MATSDGRNSAFASSKFSRRTRETYSGSKAMRLSASQPAVDQLTLRVGRRRDRLEAPVLRRLGAERDVDALELFSTGDQHGHLVAGAVLVEPILETVGAHAEIVDRNDLIVHVEPGDVGGRIALHLGD